MITFKSASISMPSCKFLYVQYCQFLKRPVLALITCVVQTFAACQLLVGGIQVSQLTTVVECSTFNLISAGLLSVLHLHGHCPCHVVDDGLIANYSLLVELNVFFSNPCYERAKIGFIELQALVITQRNSQWVVSDRISTFIHTMTLYICIVCW